MMDRPNLRGLRPLLPALLLALGMDPSGVAAQPAPLTVTSPAFEDGGAIPERNSAYGENLSPALAWAGAPEGTLSFVLIVHDRDVPVPGGFVHWVLYNLPGTTEGLPEGVPISGTLDAPPGLAGAHQGPSVMRSAGYYGPRPQSGDGPHHYVFTVYALNRPPDLPAALGRDEVLAAIRDHVIGQGILVGVYERP